MTNWQQVTITTTKPDVSVSTLQLQYWLCSLCKHNLCFLTNCVSESGYIHKTVLLQSGAHIIEEVQVFEQPQPVKSLKLSTSKVHNERDVKLFIHSPLQWRPQRLSEKRDSGRSPRSRHTKKTGWKAFSLHSLLIGNNWKKALVVIKRSFLDTGP